MRSIVAVGLLLSLVGWAQAAEATFANLPFAPLNVSADGKTVVGSPHFPSDVWYWRADTGVVRIDGDSFTPNSVSRAMLNFDGSVIATGRLDATDGVRYASVYDVSSGQWTRLSGLGGYSGALGADPALNASRYRMASNASDMSDDGKFVAGTAYVAGAAGNGRAMLWNLQAHTAINLGIDPSYPADERRATSAIAVSDDGRLVAGSGAAGDPVLWMDSAGEGNFSVVNLRTATGAPYLRSLSAISGNGGWVAGGGIADVAAGSAYRVNTTSFELQYLGRLSAEPGYDQVTAISDDGSVIFGYEGIGTRTESARLGYVWIQGVGMRALDDVLASYGIDAGNTFDFTTPLSVSADGRTIVGYGRVVGSEIEQGFVVTLPSALAVPEVPTFMLMLFGAMVLALSKLRRRYMRF